MGHKTMPEREREIERGQAVLMIGRKKEWDKQKKVGEVTKWNWKNQNKRPENVLEWQLSLFILLYLIAVRHAIHSSSHSMSWL